MTIIVSIGVDAVLIMATGGAMTVIVSIMGGAIPIMVTGGRCDRHCFCYGDCNPYCGHWGAL